MIQLSNIQVLRGGRALLEGASATIHPKHKVGLVGANGCGKSTLFALLRDEISVDEGDCLLPKNWQIASVKQETPALTKPALEYVIDGDTEYRELCDQLEKAEAAEDGNAIAHIHQQLDTIHAYSVHARAGELLFGLGFTTEQINKPVAHFSGGWRMRLNLAQALICRSDLLLLDEPTNHLDLDAVFWLEAWLKSYDGTLLLISHDRDFLDGVVKQIIHVEHKQLNVYTGNYSAFERQRAEKLAQHQAMYERQQRDIAHLQSFIDRFKAKASKAKQAQSRVKALEKMEQLAPAHVDSPFSFSFFEPPQLPSPLVRLEQVQAGYGDVVILGNIKLNLVPGSRIGLLGKNGAGKSTLIKLLSGENAPVSGNYHVSPNTKVGYFAQHQLDTLSPDDSPIQHMQRLDKQATEQQLRTYLGSFGFNGDRAFDKVAPFSGGEKARLVLALLVYQKPNLLLLDEPTNHLDLDMRHALAMALQSYTGAMVVVSHDRSLLKMTCDDYYLVHAGQVEAFNGDLEDYHEWLSQQGKAASSTSADQEKSGSTNSASDKKAQKRREAELRKLTQPTRKRITELDKLMEKQQAKLDKVEAELADDAIYDGTQQDKLNKLLADQAELSQAKDAAEEEWFELNETLEEQIAAFEAE